VGANSEHGVRRTNRDKRTAVELLLKDAEWAGKSDRWIAERCGVDHKTVAAIRESQLGNSPVDSPRTGKDGKKRKPPITRVPDPDYAPPPLDDLEPHPEGGQDAAGEPMPPPRGMREFIESWIAEQGGLDVQRRVALNLAELGYRSDYWPALNAEWPDGVGCVPAQIGIIAGDIFASLDGTTSQNGEKINRPEVNPIPPVRVLNLDACYLAEYVTEAVHLVVTSPPYNVGIEYNHHADELSTYLDLLRTVWSECHKVMADGARIAVVVPFGVGRNPWVPFAGKLMDTLTQTGFTLRGQIVWDKNTTGNRTSWGSFRLSSDPSLRDTTEAIIVAHKGSQALPLPDAVKFSDDKGPFTAPLADSDYFMELAQDHWAIAPESAKRVKHPAPFPVELVKRLIHFYAFPGAHVLDPFGGSGTAGIAARQCGCAATLVEIDADYCRLAEERLANES
jgi:site-specific DNA-methyltransferase (adenine-specific)